MGSISPIVSELDENYGNSSIKELVLLLVDNLCRIKRVNWSWSSNPSSASRENKDQSCTDKGTFLAAVKRGSLLSML